MTISGNIVDVHKRKIFHGRLTIAAGKISHIEFLEGNGKHYIMPGFIDAHIHIESSMLTPSEFSRIACPHGTVATVSDPHEIANVMGVAGIDFMIENARLAALKIHFGAPSCVPATNFETAGASLDANAVRDLLSKPEIFFLSEMMNYPGVIQGDIEVQKKLSAAKSIGKPIDGHAPGLNGDLAQKYFASGITTDHECFTYQEAKEKALLGVKILIREGSAAQNYGALHALIDEFPGQIMFCTDDLHPDDLLKGHINKIVARAISDGHELFAVLRAACLHPILHYNLPVGTLRHGEPADFIIVDDLKHFNVLQTYIEGHLVADQGNSLETWRQCERLNHFICTPTVPSDFQLSAGLSQIMPCIQAIDRELVTNRLDLKIDRTAEGFVNIDVNIDQLMLAVINRYTNNPPALSLVTGFELKSGALASSVAHDSHNIIAVGADLQSLSKAVNLVIESKGGIAAVDDQNDLILPLPVAGIISDDSGDRVAKKYQKLDLFVKEILGSSLTAPFMTLSFMALLVIPKLKLSDQGLFDVEHFTLL